MGLNNSSAHNPKVVGSNPAPATKKFKRLWNPNHKRFFNFITYIPNQERDYYQIS